MGMVYSVHFISWVIRNNLFQSTCIESYRRTLAVIAPVSIRTGAAHAISTRQRAFIEIHTLAFCTIYKRLFKVVHLLN